MTSVPPTDAAAEALHVLGHAVRLRLLTALANGERSVTDIEALTGVGQPALSKHLSTLRRAELVQTRRHAKQIFYRLHQSKFQELVSLLSLLCSSNAETSPEIDKGRLPRASNGAVFARIV